MAFIAPPDLVRESQGNILMTECPESGHIDVTRIDTTNGQP